MGLEIAIEITAKAILFTNGIKLYSEHERDCCETHYLYFNDLTLEDFEGLKFDLSSDSFFRRIEDYGIELIPTNGHSIKIAGHYSNNGYYSNEMILVIEDNQNRKITRYDISECQTGSF